MSPKSSSLLFSKDHNAPPSPVLVAMSVDTVSSPVDGAGGIKESTDSTVSLKTLIEGSRRTIELKTSTGEFLVHDTVLCHFSNYHNAALNSEFAESSTGEVKAIKDFDHKVVQHFIEWLYQCAFALQEDSNRPFRDAYNDKYLHTTDECIQLWVFADRYDVPGL